MGIGGGAITRHKVSGSYRHVRERKGGRKRERETFAQKLWKRAVTERNTSL